MYSKKVAVTGGKVTANKMNRSKEVYPNLYRVSTCNSDLEFALLWFALSATYTGHSTAMQTHAWHRFGQAAHEYFNLLYPEGGKA